MYRYNIVMSGYRLAINEVMGREISGREISGKEISGREISDREISDREISATDLLQRMSPRRVFAFDGKMGVGKTTFIKQLCEDLGTEDVVNSPTFAIVNVYDIKGDVPQVYHFDCYRLKDIHEALDFGAEDYLYSGNYCFIEWPEKIAAILPEDTVWVHITENEDGSRTMTVE